MICVRQASVDKRIESEISKTFLNELSKVDQTKFRRLLQRCSLCEARSDGLPVPSIGDFSSTIMILDSNPGKMQEHEGNALLWNTPTIRVLSKWFSDTGVALQNCYYTYTFHCRTENKNVCLYDRCALWLNYELSKLSNLKMIFTLGEDAFKCLLGEGFPRLECIYGTIYKVLLYGKEVLVVPLYHPWTVQRRGLGDVATKELILESLKEIS